VLPGQLAAGVRRAQCATTKRGVMPGRWHGKPGPFRCCATHTKHPFGNGRRGSWHRASKGSSTLSTRRLNGKSPFAYPPPTPDAQPVYQLMSIAGSTHPTVVDNCAGEGPDLAGAAAESNAARLAASDWRRSHAGAGYVHKR
jgi:hypothetical protein